ncbi:MULTISPECIES: hypothetical protein [Peptoniphilus]|uniref:hypothetical protein n=1 Tax=Peptoniphilus TaxID=162289 RepID=UPI0001DA9F67|nr:MULTISPECIES: hypothetical protein [Peptoniphilus]EFI41566.1 hypothetical protein HMPREF0629_00188 [Peptoniphilus sp. oral taxon 386 str. F0131]
MKKISIMLCLLLLLVGCKKETNQNNSINKNDNTNTTESNSTINENESTTYTYEGTDGDYSAKITISKFTDEDIQEIKETYGENSDTYLSLSDDRPEYIAKTYVLYTGEGIENIQDEEMLSVTLSCNNEKISTYELNSEKDIIGALQGKKNISELYFIYNDKERNIIPDENSHFKLEANSSKNNIINFNIELENSK